MLEQEIQNFVLRVISLCFYLLLPYSHCHQLLTYKALHMLYPSFLVGRPSTIVVLRTRATLTVDAPGLSDSGNLLLRRLFVLSVEIPSRLLT